MASYWPSLARHGGHTLQNFVGCCSFSRKVFIQSRRWPMVRALAAPFVVRPTDQRISPNQPQIGLPPMAIEERGLGRGNCMRIEIARTNSVKRLRSQSSARPGALAHPCGSSLCTPGSRADLEFVEAEFLLPHRTVS